jgi:hypothetical protein
VNPEILVKCETDKAIIYGGQVTSWQKSDKKLDKMSSGGTFVDRIDPFAKRSLKKKQRKSQGSSRYRTGGDVELTPLPLLKGKSTINYVIL